MARVPLLSLLLVLVSAQKLYQGVIHNVTSTARYN